MPKVLITAFEPYGRWKSNSSWACLIELTRNLPPHSGIVTRRYPVDYALVRKRLAEDLQGGFDFALHLGQYPGSARIHLEAIGINVATEPNDLHSPGKSLVDNGPVAYQSALPLERWAGELRAAGIPALVSYHAGTYLCNGTLYLTHHLAREMNLPTQSAFIHLPLEPSQTLEFREEFPTLTVAQTAQALQIILQELTAVPRTT